MAGFAGWCFSAGRAGGRCRGLARSAGYRARDIANRGAHRAKRRWIDRNHGQPGSGSDGHCHRHDYVQRPGVAFRNREDSRRFSREAGKRPTCGAMETGWWFRAANAEARREVRRIMRWRALAGLLAACGCLAAQHAATIVDEKQGLAGWAAALGGRDRVEQVRTLHFSGSVETGGLKGKFERWSTSSGQYRM